MDDLFNLEDFEENNEQQKIDILAEQPQKEKASLQEY